MSELSLIKNTCVDFWDIRMVEQESLFQCNKIGIISCVYRKRDTEEHMSRGFASSPVGTILDIINSENKKVLPRI